MKRVSAFKRAVTVLTGTAVMLTLVGVVAIGQGFFESDGTVHFCSDADTRAARLIMVGEECFANEFGVDIQSGAGPADGPRVLSVHRDSGPVGVPIDDPELIVSIGNVPPGNYVALAKANLESTGLGESDLEWECELVVSPPGGTAGVVDRWESHDTDDTVANLQRAITLNPTLSSSYSVQLMCVAENTLGTDEWKATRSSIILIQGSSDPENFTDNTWPNGS